MARMLRKATSRAEPAYKQRAMGSLMVHQGPPAIERDHHGNDPERITSPRQAAEALFAPKRHHAEQSVREVSPTAGGPVRKPRVLAVTSPAPVRAEERGEPVSAKRQTTRRIPRSQFARIRTWVTYGMTAPEVAEIYGAAVGEIERILEKA